MTRSLRFVAAVIAAAAAVPLFATTYIVPEDRELIRSARAIVIATAEASYSRYTSDGRLVTIAELRIEDSLKGDLANGMLVRLTEMGGTVGELSLVIAGAPRYEPGTRYLVMIGTNLHDEMATLGFGLGRFTLQPGNDGRELALRDEGDIGGFDADGKPHAERRRDLRSFVAYIRAFIATGAAAGDYTTTAQPFPGPLSVVHHPTTFALRSDYLLQNTGPTPGRWQGAPNAVFKTNGTQPGYAAGGVTSSSNAASTWTGAGNGINYSVSGTTTSTGGLEMFNPENEILFNDPNNTVANARAGCSCPVVAIGGYWTSGTYQLGGETFKSITQVDVEVGKNLTVSESDFQGILTHEMGHTLGLRHSDKNPQDNASCAAPLDCAAPGQAIMASAYVQGMSPALKQWDMNAINTVYGSGPVCTPPGISTQPVGATINSGQSANLSVTATGTSPFTYQWYTGTSGNTSSPIGGATNSSVMVSPTTTTSYWVRVTGQCAPPVDSSTATVTVAACVNPSISQQPGNVTINSGASTQLSVVSSGTGLTYQWYVGNPSSTVSPVAGGTFSSVNVSPSQTTNFWVRVTGQCGSPADSNAATVTVVCNPPAITQQPSSASITAGSSTLLTVGATGTSLTYQWYSGTAPDTTLPVAGGNSPSIQVSPSQTTNFWVRVSGACGTPQNSTTATITVGVCSSPVISGAAANPSNVLPGGSSQLSASVSGSVSGQPQWYIGAPPDKSHPVAQAGAAVTVTPSSNTTYWLQALSGCGAAAANSNVVTVTVGSSCINPTITIQPASQTVIAGTTATLGVTAGGTAPLHYQWYRGPTGTKTTTVGTDSAFFTTDPVNSITQFWVEVSNSCNGGVPAESTTATITPHLSRHRSTRH